jgi:hypothetical protein
MPKQDQRGTKRTSPTVEEGPGATAEASTSPPAAAPPIAELFRLDAETTSDAQLHAIVNQQVLHTISESPLAGTYNILLLYDKATIGRSDADRIYRALSDADPGKPILLMMYSPGGDVATAYLISKLCREFTEGDFHVALPRQAKSAATLIACGADQIHMGSLSELGPIDPQFGAIPALALKHSVEHIATLAAEYPGAAGMFADYLARSLRVEALGYYERVAESATQYAIRLLKSRNIRAERDDHEVARRLVYEYKDHGFVIDSRGFQRGFRHLWSRCGFREYCRVCARERAVQRSRCYGVGDWQNVRTRVLVHRCRKRVLGVSAYGISVGPGHDRLSGQRCAGRPHR